MPLRAVIIGAGGRGRHWIKTTAAHAGFEPVATVDPSEAAHQAVATQFPDLRLQAFRSVEAAAEKVKAEVAVIAAVSWFRRENALSALSAGWHILVEKPFALSLEDAKAVVEAGRKAGLVVSAGQNYRFNPEVGTMRQAVANGEVGRLGHGVFIRHRKRYAGNTYQKAMRHNYLWEMGVHDLDMVRFTLGLKPLRVTGFSFLPPWGDYEGETTVSALYEFEQGVKVSYFGAWASHVPEYHWRIDGSGGSLRVGNGLERGSPADKAWSRVEPLGQFGGDAALLNELAAAVETGGETSTSGRDNLWTVAMMEGVVRSTEAGGQPVSIAEMVEG
ncbi:Gfo/Idh/MocA family oxidoreductase [bacterium]|nr:Gfo/Idh/MocA family oxidoreductase [bacterium]